MAEQLPTETISPCPFCGREASMQFYGDGFSIECQGCHAMLFQRPLHEGDDNAKRRLAERWNTRSSAGAEVKQSHLHCDGCGDHRCVGIQAMKPPQEPSPEWVLKARAEGRAEAMALLLASSAEDFPDECIGSHAIGDTGDYGCHWDAEALNKLLRVGENVYSYFDSVDAAYWSQAAKIMSLEQRLAEKSSGEPSVISGIARALSYAGGAKQYAAKHCPDLVGDLDAIETALRTCSVPEPEGKSLENLMNHSFDGQDRTYYLKAQGRESFSEAVARRRASTTKRDGG